ncbi:MAG: beta-glucosidase, partial [Rhodospirillaceae bacterium]|nr:beta-glucosidase [Rhodospirillaceae bacterium]
MKKQFCLLFLISLLWVTSVLLVSAQEEADAPYLDPTLPVAERVEDLLGRMTLEEKIGQMTLVEKNSILVEDIGSMGIGGLLSGGGGSPVPNTPASWAAMIEAFQGYALQSRLGIPLIYGVDAVHGHGNLYGAVIFPHNIGLGAANNPELMEQIGRITAIETAATGIFWNYGPALSVARDVRWGRTYESLSEDPTLVGELATAYLIGLQGDDLTASDTVMGTPKHFVGDGGTTWGTPGRGDYSLDQGDTRVDEETLREVYLAPYLPAIEAGAQSIMISFSSWNGEKMHGQKYLITDVLRGELGFDGFIVSDWAGMDHIAPNDYAASMVTGINAGIDMNMVPYDYIRFIITLLAAVENEDVSMERIDDAVRNILTAKFNLGLFENPYADPDLLATVGSAAHREVARQAVSESLVLLKNENDLLPLAPDVETVFVAGELADDIGGLCGGWSIQWQGGMGDITIGTTILDGIMNSVDNPDTVHYDKNGNFDDVADIGIVVVGEEPYAEGEGDDNDLNLTGSQRRLIRKMREKVDTLIIILVSGRPMTITPELEEADAFVAAWLPGTEGQGVADVLFGYRPFSGKLSFTWPRDMDQIPFDYN